MTQTIDALFIPVYVNVDRWDNDDVADDPGPNPARRHGVELALSEDHFKEEIDLVVDGKLYDVSRVLSLARYGTTAEYQRYDAFNITLLSGSYYLNLLHRHGFSARVANIANRHSFAELGRHYAPRFVMLSTTLALDSNEHETIPMAVRQIRRQWPDAIVVLGGLLLVSYRNSYSRAWFDNLLRYYGADVYVVSAQSEHPALEILRRGSMEALLDGPRLPATYIVAKGEVHGPAETPEPGYSMADGSIAWSTLPQTEHLYHTVHMRTARSCAFQCAFCEYPVNQGPLTLAPIEAVERELAELRRLGTVRSIIFTDDTFNVPLRRFKDLLRVLAKYEFTWYSFFRPQVADAETVALMKQSGCRGVMVGLESADNQILRNMHKNAQVDHYRRGVALLKQAGIHVHAGFIIGFPGETEETAYKVARFIDELEIDFTTINPWVYLPSTPIAQRAAEFGLEGSALNWRHATMDSAQANLLARAVAQEQKAAVHNSARGRPWLEFLFYANGLSVGEARTVIGTYNRLIARANTREMITRGAETAELRAILARHEFPRPYPMAAP